MDAYISQIAMIVFYAVLGIAALGFVGWCIESLWALTGHITIHHSIADWLDDHAAPEWRIAHRLRSVQIALFWSVLGGLWVALPSFQQYLTPFHMMFISVGFSVAIMFARFTGQKGLPDA
jgi:hypothetical protein